MYVLDLKGEIRIVEVLLLEARVTLKEEVQASQSAALAAAAEALLLILSFWKFSVRK